MTVMEFLDKLSATPREWSLQPSCFHERRQLVRLRLSTEMDCPYTAVDGTTRVELIGPGAVPWSAVWNAADDAPGHNPVIRRALLDACGLQEA